MGPRPAGRKSVAAHPLEYVCTNLFGLTYLLVYVLSYVPGNMTPITQRGRCAALTTTTQRALDGKGRKPACRVCPPP
jgi:hypothetical protein